MGIFELVKFKVILGLFSALVSKWPVTKKAAVGRAKRTEILGLVDISNTYRVPLTMYML